MTLAVSSIETGLTVRAKMHFRRGLRGRKRIEPGQAPAAPEVPAGRVQRISRLMALAIRFDRLVREGHIRDYAELARLGHVTRARATQIMNLLNLAPDIQEDILNLPLTLSDRDPISERQMRRIVTELDWRKQRDFWLETIGKTHPCPRQPQSSGFSRRLHSQETAENQLRDCILSTGSVESDSRDG